MIKAEKYEARFTITFYAESSNDAVMDAESVLTSITDSFPVDDAELDYVEAV